MKAWITAAALLPAALLYATAPRAALAQDPGAAEFAATTLSLTASGEVRTRPDLAVVSLGVRADAPSATAAFSEARGQMAAIVSALHRQDVADADVQTSELNLQAQYAGGDDGAARHLTGYQASNNVSVRLHDLARVGAVIDALVSAGANAVNGVSFELADPTAATDEARRRAVKALQAKADLYAQATGYRLQRLVSLSESGGGYAGPPGPMFAMRRVAPAATPVAAGELSVSVSLSAQYQLVR